MDLAIFYHVCRHINPDHGLNIMHAQLDALRKSGLLKVAKHFRVGVNGDLADLVMVSELIPEATDVFMNPKATWESGEVPTINAIQKFSSGNPDHYVMYHHMKGLSYPPGTGLHDLSSNWRWCMQTHVVDHWQRCIGYLGQGYEVVGVHWHTPEKFPGVGHVPYFAGNFWWANGKFLATLPPLNPEGHLAGGRYEAEAWLGRGKRWPSAMDMKGCSVWDCHH